MTKLVSRALFCDPDNEVENICVILLYLAKQVVFKAIFQDAYTKLLFVFPESALYSLLLCSFLKLWKKKCSFAPPHPPLISSAHREQHRGQIQYVKIRLRFKQRSWDRIETFRSDNDYDYEIRTWKAGTRL